MGKRYPGNLISYFLRIVGECKLLYLFGYNTSFDISLIGYI